MLVKLPQAAAHLGVPQHRVKRWAQRGRIPTLRVGRSVYFDTEVLELWRKGLWPPPELVHEAAQK